MPQYTVERDNKIIGKYSAEQIKELTSSGELLGTDIVYVDNPLDWQTIVEFSVSQEVASELTKDRGEGLLNRSWEFYSKTGGHGITIAEFVFFSMLFALVTMWISSLFSDIRFWSRVYHDVNVVYGPFEDDGFGPIQFFVRIIWLPVDNFITCREVFYIWTLICAFIGIIVGSILKMKAAYTFNKPDEPFAIVQRRILTIATALLMILVITVTALGKRKKETNRAFLIAAKEGNIEAVKKQLALGANVNVSVWAKDPDGGILDSYIGYTALQFAINEGDKEMLELLVGKGADVNVKTPNFQEFPVLYQAVTAPKNRKEIVELLLSNGAEVNARWKFGDTVLYEAVQYTDNIEIIKLLLAKGADVNDSVGLNYSPFEKALRGVEVCGKDLDRAKSEDKEKHQKRLDKMKEIVELLREHGGKE